MLTAGASGGDVFLSVGWPAAGGKGGGSDVRLDCGADRGGRGTVMRDAAAMLAWVALGSAFGGAARFFVSGWFARTFGDGFPWGTVTVNVTGSVAIGVLAALAARSGLSGAVLAGWPVAVTGFLGSYTTVSSFSLQTLVLARDAGWRRAGVNVALSLVLCLGGAALGFAATAVLAGGPAG